MRIDPRYVKLYRRRRRRSSRQYRCTRLYGPAKGSPRTWVSMQAIWSYAPGSVRR